MERLLERPIENGKGTREDRVRAMRRSNRLLIVAAIFNGIAVVFGLLGQQLRPLWLSLGVFWVAFSCFLYRQRRYLGTLSADG